ncbi:MAG: YajQ family cyclic di-GMP-binding protein [Bdellovibrionales bacterium]|nr:YajQ family cyclic di-GMP-binding protein [Bdellovibrionales bacterium]
MPSFDISSDVDWQELDNAVNQATKEITTRFDFKNIKTEITYDKKAKTLTLVCSEEAKLDNLRDVIGSKMIKRGISTLSLDYKTPEPAFGGSVRQVIAVMAGISKEKGKEVIAAIKASNLKVQGQIQDEQVRVTGKSRDDLQECMAMLKSKQESLKLPMQFGNFRD